MARRGSGDSEHDKNLTEELERQLLSLPDTPGVYLFKDENDEIVYIGKAVSLRSRVKSYWNNTGWRERPKLLVMMPKIVSIETILTNSEKEALILESTLVRRHRPKYNVALKDDKRYPWLAITYDEPFPRLIMVREPSKFRKTSPKAKVFGPYVEAGLMWQTVRILRKVFPMRQKRTPPFKDRPCMNYYIGLCLAPCQKLVAEPEYNIMVEQVEMFLAGRQNEVLELMKKDMAEASKKLEYEQAAKIRNRIKALETVIEKQQVFVADRKMSQDVLAEAHTEKTVAICLLRVREGMLVASDTYTLPLVEKTSAQEAFQSFVDQYYTACEDVAVPKEVIVSHDLEDVEALAEMLTGKAKRNVKVVTPKKGRKSELIDLAVKNAQSHLMQMLEEETHEDQKVHLLLSTLKEELGLKKLPRRIECFDISNIQGVDNVASMVVFVNGQSKKSDYRTFKIRGVEGEANDFASMKEVVGRRYKRIIEEEKPMPDLIIIDGGKGQLGAAREALSELSLNEVDIVGLAKKQEEVYLPGQSNPVLLPRRGQALHLLQRVRDEAHRFAVTFHRKRRAKRSLVSGMDDLPGVGSSRRKLLLDHFGSLEKIRVASVEELQAVPGISAKLAAGIFAELHKADA